MPKLTASERTKKIYFKEDKIEIMDYYIKQKNKSEYIVTLIENDMNGLIPVPKEVFKQMQDILFKLQSGSIKIENIEKEEKKEVEYEFANNVLNSFFSFDK